MKTKAFRRACALFALAALPAAAPVRADTLIHAGILIDGLTDEAAARRTVRVADGRIASVEEGFVRPGPGDELIDLSGAAVLPGLMDMHVHIASEYSRDSNLNQYTLNEADHAINAVMHAKRTLDAGFTVVRNLGGDFNVSVALRDAINAGKVPGPRIYTSAKSLASTGGHADPTNGWADHLGGEPTPYDGVVNGAADARRAVRQRYKDGADWIKITATGGVLSVAASGRNPQFTDEELEAIVSVAADYGMRVAAHAHGAEGMRRAVLAGVASIEHGTYMTEEVMDLMIERGVWYVPTILAGDWVAEKAEVDGFFPELVRPKAAAIGPLIGETFARAYARGVPIVFGTDTGVSAHGGNAREFALMVAGGMPEMEAIRSATGVAAAFLGIDGERGGIAPGLAADIIAVEGDPLEDIRALERVVFVMKDGTVHKGP